MIAQALEANGAIVYILGRREEVLKEAAATAVSFTVPRSNRVVHHFGCQSIIEKAQSHFLTVTHRSMVTFTYSKQM